MSKPPIRKDAVAIAAVLVVAALLMLASRLMPRSGLEDRVAQETLAPDAVEYLSGTPGPEDGGGQAAEETATDAPPPKETAVPAGEKAGASEDGRQEQVFGPMPAPQAQEVRGYVVLTVNGRQYGDPIPMDRDKIITLRQDDGKINRVHITPEEVYMESSTCDNQDCVYEGTVTLDNYETRILGTWIICLPNAVTVEMVPADGD